MLSKFQEAIKEVESTLPGRCKAAGIELITGIPEYLRPIHEIKGVKRQLEEHFIFEEFEQGLSKERIVDAMEEAENDFMRGLKVISHKGWDCRVLPGNRVIARVYIGK